MQSKFIFTRNWQNLYQTRLENMPINDSWSETATLLQQLSNKIGSAKNEIEAVYISLSKNGNLWYSKQHNKLSQSKKKLRQLAVQIETGQPISPATLNNIDNKINGLLARYDLQNKLNNRFKTRLIFIFGLDHEWN